MSRSLVQSDASRRNGVRSLGPTTAEGKLRASDNARRHGLRSADPDRGLPIDDSDFQALERAVDDRLSPTGDLEATICRRIAVALWRIERIDRLEADFWDRDGLNGNGTNEPGLDTILRYQTSAANALSRALRDLEKLRSGRLDPTAGTNEPKPGPAGYRLPSLPELLAELRRGGFDPNGTNDPGSGAPQTGTNEPELRLNRHQRRRQAALRP